MPKLSQRGVIHLLVPLILIAGIFAAVFLIKQGPKIFKSRASVSGPISGPIDGNPLPNPIAYWKFDESSGNYAYNFVYNSTGGGGTSLVGTVNNAIFAPGKYNNGLQFNGASSYIKITNDPRLMFGTADVTISAWFKTSTTGVYQFILSKGGFSGPNYPFYGVYIIPGNKVQFLISDCGTRSCNQDVSRQPVISSSVVTDNQWHHVAGVRKSTGYELYLDGNLEAARTEPARNSDDNIENLYIGNQMDQNYFAGMIDEVKIYNSALTQGQVVEDMNSNVTITPTPTPQTNIDQRVANLEAQLTETQNKQNQIQSTIDKIISWIKSVFPGF